MKTNILYLSMLFPFTVLAQKGPHKGEIFIRDSIRYEVVYPAKKTSTFKVYITKDSLDATKEIRNAVLTFYFDRGKSDFVEVLMSKQEDYLSATLEEWEEFFHADLNVKINGIKRKLEFWNKQLKQAPTGGSQSGHSH